MDRGYVDYGLFGRWDDEDVFFVTRVKSNMAYRVLLLTNHLEFAAGMIGRIYKDRWQIELFSRRSNRR
jgi:IS4 transposase